MLLWLLVRARGVTVVQGVHECVCVRVSSLIMECMII